MSNLDLSRIQALCFDVDGTLRDTDDQYVAMVARFLNPIRFFFDRQEQSSFARRVVMALESPANFLYSIPDWLGIDDEINVFREYIYKKGWLKPKPTDHYLLIEGIREMLVALTPHYPMAVISARDMRGTLGFLDHFELTPFFHCIAAAQTTPHTKPWPDPVLWAAQQMGVEATACLMVGDTTVDIRAGKAAGAQTVGVLCGFGEQKELQQAGATCVLSRTPDLQALLLNSPSHMH